MFTPEQLENLRGPKGEDGQDAEPELTFNSYYEFPNVGESHRLYIATNENKIYRFDTSKNAYVAIITSSSSGDVSIREIDGGDASTKF